jgi:hypothetical protein
VHKGTHTLFADCFRDKQGELLIKSAFSASDQLPSIERGNVLSV